jgi:hypothetical protein
MPIQLTTAFDPGDLDPEKSYTHVKIVHLEHSIVDAFIRLVVARGYLDEGAFVESQIAKRAIYNIVDEGEGTDYTSMVAETVVSGDVGEKVYDVNAQHLYQWLIDKGYYAGTIE